MIGFSVFTLLVAGGTTAFASMGHGVTLNVDGETQDVRSFGGTVSDLLESNDITLQEGDQVDPELNTTIGEVDSVDVEYAKDVTVAVDGDKSAHTTHASTVNELLDDLDVDVSDSTYVSDGADTHIPREDYTLVVSHQKDLTVKTGDGKNEITTAAPTVAEALDDGDVSVDTGDKVKPGRDSLVEDDQKITVVHTETVERDEEVDIAPPVKVVDDDSLEKGKKTVEKEGEEGKALQHVEVELADGDVQDRDVLSSKVYEKPTKRVVHKGTKEPADDDSDSSSDDSDDSGDSDDSDDSSKDFGDEGGDTMWDKIAECESGGDWHINTGNGYYGGLQFDLQTWHSVGGEGRPDQHSREEQIKRAEKLKAERGLSPWGCAGAAG